MACGEVHAKWFRTTARTGVCLFVYFGHFAADEREHMIHAVNSEKNRPGSSNPQTNEFMLGLYT